MNYCATLELKTYAVKSEKAMIKGVKLKVAAKKWHGKDFNNNTSGEFVLPYPWIQHQIHLNCC